MKVLHLSSEGPWRGGEQQIAYLISELSQKGVQSHVAVKKSSGFETWCDKHKVPFTSIRFRNSIDLVSAFKLLRIIKKFSPDIIHVHSSKSHGIVGLASLLCSIKIPVILSRRVSFPIKNGFLSTRKYFLKSLKKIICVSDDVKSTVEQLEGMKSKTITVYDGIDVEKYAAGGKDFLRKTFDLPNDALIVGNTSALTEEKDYFTFIDVAEAVNEQQDREVHFFVIGRGPLEEDLKQYARKKGHGDKIHFTGFVDNVEDYLAGLDIFLFTSTQEGLGTSVLNAFATGTPVVSTNVGGLPELIRHMENGILINPGDSAAISSHLKHLFCDRQLRDNLAQKAYASLADFTYTKMADKTYDVYQEILEGAR